MQWSVMGPAVDGTSAWRDLHVSLVSLSSNLLDCTTSLVWSLTVHLTLVDGRSSL